MLINASGLLCGSLGRATLKSPSIRLSSMERLDLQSDETRSSDSYLWLFFPIVSSFTTAYHAFFMAAKPEKCSQTIK